MEQIIVGTKNGGDKFPNLIVGNSTNDDAAVVKISETMGLISTTDFFTPIVDDPFLFGKIAAVNALSDIYAMGGTPVSALSILGWPITKLPVEAAKMVIDGAVAVCEEADIPLAGGHSIEIADPVFGLSVNGTVPLSCIKRNSTAKANSKLFLTKPLGVGVMATALKQGVLTNAHYDELIDVMTTLNRVGTKFGECAAICAMTDVTGFGLLGHLIEICRSSNLIAEIEFDKIPTIGGLQKYLEMRTIPGGAINNWDLYRSKVSGDLDEFRSIILSDPQTSGGLLIAVEDGDDFEVVSFAKTFGIELFEIGYLKNIEEKDFFIKLS